MPFVTSRGSIICVLEVEDGLFSFRRQAKDTFGAFLHNMGPLIF